MNTINLHIDISKKVEMTSSSGGITGENNAVMINFHIPREYSDFNKYLDVFKENGDKTQTVLSLSDESEFSYVLPGEFTDNLNIFMQVVMKKGNVVFKSYRFSLVFEEGINATSYIESEYKDSIQTLFEIKADKSDTEEIEKDLARKVSYAVYSEEIKNINDTLSKKAEKEEIPEVPTKISDLIDDTGDISGLNAIAYANHSATSEYADEAHVAGISEEARRDSRYNVIHETYATKKEVSELEKVFNDDISSVETSIGDIEAALDGILSIQNRLLGVNE